MTTAHLSGYWARLFSNEEGLSGGLSSCTYLESKVISGAQQGCRRPVMLPTADMRAMCDECNGSWLVLGYSGVHVLDAGKR